MTSTKRGFTNVSKRLVSTIELKKALSACPERTVAPDARPRTHFCSTPLCGTPFSNRKFRLLRKRYMRPKSIHQCSVKRSPPQTPGRLFGVYVFFSLLFLWEQAIGSTPNLFFCLLRHLSFQSWKHLWCIFFLPLKKVSGDGALSFDSLLQLRRVFRLAGWDNTGEDIPVQNCCEKICTAWRHDLSGSDRSTRIASDLASRALTSQAKPQRESELRCKWEAYCSTNWRFTAVFPFLRSLEASKARRYKCGSYCGTNWRCTASAFQASCTGWGSWTVPKWGSEGVGEDNSDHPHPPY